MSRLFYDIRLEEEYDHEGEPYQERVMSKEHFEKVKEWLPNEFKKCKIHNSFNGLLENAVESCTMKCIYKKDGEGLIPVARITIDFKPGFRLSHYKRQACWDTMDGQMTDGFGEIYDGKEIPDADGWQLRF